MADRPNQPRRWTLVAAAFVLGVLVVGAVFVIVSRPRGGGDENQSANTPTAAPSSSTPTPTVSDTSAVGCGVTDHGKKIPASAPPVSWKIWRGAALPQSASAGPIDIDDDTGITKCYAHTPTGALMAAINIDVRMAVAAPDTTIVEKQVAPGPYKSQFKSTIANSQHPSTLAQVAGFQFVTYSGPSATIKIAFGNESDGYIDETSNVVWQHGTWMSVIGAGDATGSNVEQLDSLVGFVKFKGVG